MEKGKALHSKDIKGDLQIDTILIKIPFGALSAEDLELLDLWMVEDFYYGRVDWSRREIVCEFQTEHYLPN